KNYFVDLFAGCGGLSLGLENAGFIPAYVNELDSDAMESYLINRDEEFPLLREKYSSFDIQENLTQKKNALDKMNSSFEEDYGIKKGELGLVVGGPPCQGYSAIGIRRTFTVDRKDIPSNYLFKDMIKVINTLSPKAFIFENVAGLMRGRWTPDGKSGEIWKDVQSAFMKIKGYEVGFELVHAKSYGVPQNRPRIIMVGLRDDFSFEDDNDIPARGLLPDATNDFPNPEELFDDIIDDNYRETLITTKYPSNATTKVQKKLRKRKDGTVSKKGDRLVDHEYSNHADKIIKKFQYMIDNNGEIPEEMKTKKFAQRVIPRKWSDGGPNITATSLPDDFVHYSQPRSLTVREWARLQMFPDWYRFSGKRTTGGRRRAGDLSKGDWKRETPKYTQIGNAVPVKLAEEIGKHLKSIIS
ncbi:DNA cytosine methyltransferase, partial [Candidatus Nitrosopelagicus sp.]|nr:DNA cytosine methyltransferase [Candidatus Nitrosopelagicus sp.]